MLALLLDSRWVHRRVELVRFVDAGTVHRQMSVDFTLPTDSYARGLRHLHPRVAPLAMLKKRELSRFSLWDEDGRRLPMYTTEQNSGFAAATLVALVRVAAVEEGVHPHSLPSEVVEAFRRVAREPTRIATVVLACLKGDVAVDEALGQLGSETPPAAIRQESSSLVSNLSTREVVQRLRPHAQLTQTLMQSKGLNLMAQQLARQFVVLTELSGDPDARRVIKFSYEEPPSSYKPELTPLERAVRPLRTLLETLSWWHKTITLDSVPVGTACSYHVEIEAPNDIEFVAARLTAEDPERTTDEPYRAQSTSTDPQRAHLQVSGAPRAVTGPIWVQVRAARDGFLRSALTLAVIVAALLWVAKGHLAAITGGSGNAQAAAAILLAIPALLAVFLVRPGEHQMATRLLFGVRVLLALSAGCALAAAVVITDEFGLNTVRAAWTTCTWVASGLAGGLLLSYFMPYATPRV